MKKIIKLSMLASLMCGVGLSYATDEKEDDQKPVPQVTPVVGDSASTSASGEAKPLEEEKKETLSGGAVTEISDAKPAEEGDKDAAITKNDAGGSTAGDKGAKKSKGWGCFSCFSSK